MKKFSALLMFCLPVLFSSCSFNTGIDTLLSPPKLSAQQEQIYNALKNYTGTNISLKYPKTGKNLSAFIVDDIDGDSEDEAIVFYQKNGTKPDDTSLRINILDKVDSQWQCVYDQTADGNEIEQVDIVRLGKSDKINIIAGYSLINRNEKAVSVYDYSDGELTVVLDSESYSVFDTADLNGDGANELFIASSTTPSKEAAAVVYCVNDNGEYSRSSIILDESYINYRNISYSKNVNGQTSVFLDAETGNGNIVTEVFKTDINGKLKHVFCPDIEKGETMRPITYLSRDIDRDGKVEIPDPYFCEGYDENSDDPIYFTSWYNISNGRLKHKCKSWFSITDGYIFIIPEEWYGKITAKADENEVILLEKDNSREILTLKIISDNENKEAFSDDGFELLRSRGAKKFFIKINENSSLVNSAAEIMMKFKFEE